MTMGIISGDSRKANRRLATRSAGGRNTNFTKSVNREALIEKRKKLVE